MTPEAVLDVMQRATWSSVEIAGPLLAIGIVVGLIMGLIQAATQISEPSLTFVPKLLALGAGLIYLGPYMLERMTAVGREMFQAIAHIGP